MNKNQHHKLYKPELIRLKRHNFELVYKLFLLNNILWSCMLSIH